MCWDACIWKAYVLLHKHRPSAGCEIHEMHFHAFMASVVETLARQVLNDESHIPCSGDAGALAMVYLRATKRIATRQQGLLRDGTPEQSPMQTFLLHISHFHSNWFMDASFLQASWWFPLSRWSVECRSRFQTLDTKAFLVVERAVTGILSKNSNILYPKPGSRVFAARPFARSHNWKLPWAAGVWKPTSKSTVQRIEWGRHYVGDASYISAVGKQNYQRRQGSEQGMSMQFALYHTYLCNAVH